MNLFKIRSKLAKFLFVNAFLLSLILFAQPLIVSAQLVGDSCDFDKQCGSSDLFCYKDVCTSKSGSSFSDYPECWSALMGKVDSPKAVCCQTFSNNSECLSSSQVTNGFNECVDTRYSGETESQAITRCCVQWPQTAICNTNANASGDLPANLCLNKNCDAGYTCNPVNGQCVVSNGGSGAGAGTGSGSGSGSGSSGAGAGSGSSGSSAACTQVSCPSGFCETNGLCLPKSNMNTGIASSTNLLDLLVKIIKLLLTFSGVIAVLILVIGGFWYITSSGNEEQAEKGQKTITNAIIGLVVVIMAYAIVTIITATLISDKLV